MITVYHFESGSLQVNTVFVCLGEKFFRRLSAPLTYAPSYPYLAIHPQLQPSASSRGYINHCS